MKEQIKPTYADVNIMKHSSIYVCGMSCPKCGKPLRVEESTHNIEYSHQWPELESEVTFHCYCSVCDWKGYIQYGLWFSELMDEKYNLVVDWNAVFAKEMPKKRKKKA